MAVITHPHADKCGVAYSGAESVRPGVGGLVGGAQAERPPQWESRTRLEDFLTAWNVPGLQGIDTRALVRRLRESGTQRGVLHHSSPPGFTSADLEELRIAAKAAPSVSQLDLVSEVSAVLPLG